MNRIGCLFVALCLAGTVGAAAEESDADDLETLRQNARGLERLFEAVADKVKASVVHVSPGRRMGSDNAKEADPAGYVARSPDVREALEAAQDAPDDPVQAQRAAELSLDVQEHLGVPATEQRVQTASHASGQVAQLEDPATGARGPN